MSEPNLKEGDFSSQPNFSFGQSKPDPHLVYQLLGCQTSPEPKRSLLSRTLTLTNNTMNSSPRFRARHSVFTPQTQEKAKPVHSNSADLGKEKTVKNKRSSEFFKKKKEPKIIITPAQDDRENRKSVDSPPEIKSILEIPSPLPQPAKSHIPGIFRRKTAKQKDLIDTVKQIRHRQSLTRSTSIRALNIETGKLLNVIAHQAMFGKNPEISKVFLTALKKVNPKALDKARKLYIKKRRRKLSWYFRKARVQFKKFLLPWNPDSIFMILWKTLILVAIIVQCFFSTYTLAFSSDDDNESRDHLMTLDLMIDLLYAFEILCNFRTSFYTQGELCTDSKAIAKNYLKSTFIIDIASEISLLGRLNQDSTLKFLVLFDLLRVLHLPRIIGRLEDYIQFSRMVSSMLQLVKLIMAIVVFAHWWACCIFSITRVDPPGSMNWIVESGLDTSNIGEIYVASMYWSIATMTTIGYGDIHPTTYKERVLCIVIMIASSVIFGYILNSIGSLLNEINAFHSESREKIRLLTKYMSDKGLTKDIQSKIRKYLEFYLHKENTMKMEGDNILQLLSINLKEEIIKEVNVKILGDTYMFSSNFRKKLLYIIAKDLVEKSLAPDEIVFQHNDQDDCSVYFITSGKVEVFYDKCAVSVQRLSKGENFGFLSFFAEKPRTASVKSVEFSTVFQLKREKFLERLEEFPSEKETYCMIKDSINLYENYQYLNLRCFSCQSKKHITLNCPKFHFVWNKPKIITTYLFEREKFRKDFKRIDRERFRARGRMEEVLEATMQLQVVQQNELNYQSFLEEQQEVQLYSEDEEMLDRNIYNLRPILYTAEAVQTKALSLPKLRMNNSIHSLSMIKDFKRREAGDVQSFVMANYDVYYHSLNLDRVKNFEVYYPNHNVAKLVAEFELKRVERMVQMKLGSKAKHISGLLVKSFRFNERRMTRELASPGSLASSGGDSGRKMNVNRSISKVNPADITFYSSLKKMSVDFAIPPSQTESLENTPLHRKSRSSFHKEKFGKLTISGIAPSLEEQETMSWNPGKLHSLERESDEGPLIKSAISTNQRNTLPITKSEFHHHSLQTEESQAFRMSSRQSDEESNSNSSEDDPYEELPMDFSPSLKYKAQKKLNSATQTIQNASYSDKAPILLSVSKLQTSTPQLDPQFDLSYDMIPSRKIESSNLKYSQFKSSGSVTNVIATEFEDEEGYQGFDFSRQMKKLSSKLEENRSLSTFKRKKSTKNSKRKKEKEKEKEKEESAVPDEDLLSLMVRAKNNKGAAKERAASEDQAKDVSKVIEDYGIRDIVKKASIKQL